MFQTEINHFFQSFASDELTAIMRFITALGYQQFFMLLLIFLLLMIDFKKAFVLFIVLLWTATITYVLKDYFDLPRPFHVDSTLALLDGDLPDDFTFDFSKRGATSFWGSISADVLEVTRQAEGLENGFPSGHSSVAIAFWAALALLYRKKWLNILAVALMVLIPLSRIYLGVHFLADVLSGVALGGIILGIFYAVVLKAEKLTDFLAKDTYAIGFNPASILLLVSPFIFLFLIPPRVYILVAYLVGFGLGFLLLSKKGLPISEAPLLHRIGRTVIGIATFFTATFILKIIAEQMGLQENIWALFIRNLLTGLALMWLGTEISIRLGWFKRSNREIA